MNYREFADAVKKHARDLRDTLHEPQEDWPSLAFIEDGDGVTEVFIDPRYFADRPSKRYLVQDKLVPMVRESRARKVALLITMFTLSGDHAAMRDVREQMQAGIADPRNVPRLQDIPESVEQLAVSVFDAERHEFWVAPITRGAAGPPHLGRFELLGGVDAMDGAMVNPIKAALR